MPQPLRTFVIDGSNAVYAVFGPWPETLKEQNRCAWDFISALNEWALSVSEFSIELVFDGFYRAIPAVNRQRLRVIFSDQDKADSIILERIRSLIYFKEKVTLVTRDRDLAEEARRENAKILDPQKFWSMISQP